MGRRNQKRDVLSGLNFYLKEIEPLTKSQVAVFDSDKHLMLHGCAGTGKTFISLYLALDDLQKEEYSRIVLVRSAVPTREMGFLPGTEDEKSKVYEAPYVNIMQELFSRGDNPYGQLKQKGVYAFFTDKKKKIISTTSTNFEVNSYLDIDDKFFKLNSCVGR